ncbi:DUF2993 domain-containing protein [Gordonia sp. PKS22-38]|uniref:DUF2993 domain-containing protein n=1 Tax=Gordonia prachuapensis TaxID=3115651 RepID=A0ABU7MT33_9ACTN|nr:DUF2993 domain-containing protein [Gordonia sp. PKS22-38]
MWRSAVNKAPEERRQHASNRTHRRARRWVGVGALGLVVAIGVALLADTFVAMRAEHSFSRALLTSPRLTFDPEVTISGFPFVGHARTGEFTGVVITARGVGVGCPSTDGCRAEMGATLGATTVPDGFRIEESDIVHTASVDGYVRLDSVNLGRMLGITDLTVNTPAPAGRAGAGGPGDGLLRRSSGVLLTGTVPLSAPPPDSDVPPSASAYPGPVVKVSVVVDLSVVDGRLHLEATDFYRGPEEHVEADVADDQRDHVLSEFTATLPPMPMPWGTAPTRAHSEGSDVVLAGDSGSRDVRPADF